MFALMAGNDIFVSRKVGNQVFVSPDFNQPMEKKYRERDNYHYKERGYIPTPK